MWYKNPYCFSECGQTNRSERVKFLHALVRIFTAQSDFTAPFVREIMEPSASAEYLTMVSKYTSVGALAVSRFKA